ncbi:MAG: hypothetical protein MR681_04755 [Prevotella sp.]|nr:hypothetical protein [Prevotella sp.]
MKKTFILNVFVAVATALGTMLLMTSCQHSDDEKEVHFQLKEHEVEVPADESNVQIAYELSAHASAADIKCTCNEQWVNNFDASQPGVIVFHVEKNMENVQREAKIEMTCSTANKQTLTVRQGARKPDFEISYQVNSSEIIMDITPAYEDSTYIFSLYDREKVPTDEDVEKEFRTEIDHLLNTTSQMGLTVEEALAQLVAKKHTQTSFTSLKENTEYVGFALYIDTKTGQFLSKPVVVSVKTEKAKPSDNKLSIEVSDIKARKATVHFTTTSNDQYAFVYLKWENWKTYSEEEILNTLTESSYKPYLTLCQGNYSVPLTGLSPETEYAVVAFGYSGSVVTTPMTKAMFTTGKNEVANITFKLEHDKYYDGTKMAELYPNDYAGAAGCAVLPVKVKIDGAAVSYHYGLYAEDVLDPSSRSDEDLIGELMYYGISSEESAFFVPYGQVCTAVGYAVDADGNYSPVFRERIYLTEEGVSPLNDKARQIRNMKKQRTFRLNKKKVRR